MDISRFAKHLEQASREAIEVARRHVTNPLPDEVRYCLRTDVYDADETVGRLNQNGAVPVWIDIYVDSSDEQFTYLRLIWSHKTSDSDERLRYQSLGCPPFQVTSPVLPPGGKGLDRDCRLQRFTFG